MSGADVPLDADAAHTNRAAAASRAGLLVAVGVGFIGMAFGAQAQTDGFSFAQAMFLSAGMFTGASQFAYLAVIRDGGSSAAAVASAAVLGLRNTLYGLAVRDYFPHRRAARIVAGQLTIDESTVVATAAHESALADGVDEDRARATAWHAFLVAGLGVFVAWNVGTAIGFVGANAIPDPERFGLDVVFPAGFLALLAPRFATPAGRRVALVALVITAVAYPIAPAGVPVLLSAAAVLAVRSSS